MGIEFTGLDEVTQERLQQQIETMAAEAENLQKAAQRRRLNLLPTAPGHQRQPRGKI